MKKQYFLIFLLALCMTLCGLFGCKHKQSCISPDANGNGDSADDLQAILDKGEDLCLCENKIYNLSTNQCGKVALCYHTDGQKIYTQNLPNAETGTSHAATLRINNADVTTILRSNHSNTQLKSVIFDGNRPNLRGMGGDALVQMGLDSSGQIIEHNLFKNTRTWSTLQIHEGGNNCTNSTVAYNRIEDAGCDKDGNGCAPGDKARTWADGISFACQNSSVHDNVIMNATDGGIVLYSPRGSKVYNNTITAVNRIMLGGINMVDDITFRTGNRDYADYSNVQVYGNTIDASGNVIDVGIAQGNLVWFCPQQEHPVYHDNVPLHGASVTNNIFKGAHMRWGAVIDGVHDWTFDNNIFNAEFSGPSKISCTGDAIPAAVDCRRHDADITGANVFQSQCVDVNSGESLHAVLIDNTETTPTETTYTVRMSNVDDNATLYINDQLLYRAKWGYYGTEPTWYYVAHQPGDSGEFDITNHLVSGNNALRFTLWNQQICCDASLSIAIKKDGIIIFSDSIDINDSSEGIKYDRTFTIIK